MKHEMACLHWSTDDYAFCKNCFQCYFTKTGKVANENGPDNGSCPGKTVSQVGKKFKEEFEQTGKIGKYYFDTTAYITEHVSNNTPFIVTSLF